MFLVPSIFCDDAEAFKWTLLADKHKYKKKKIRAVNTERESHLFRNDNYTERRRLLRKTGKRAEYVRLHPGKWGEEEELRR